MLHCPAVLHSAVCLWVLIIDLCVHVEQKQDVVLQAWNLTGDAFTKGPGEKPWISEM